ncbi:YerC/YecD family TrpR-related protein [Butyricicoccus sp. Marseille-Q5471]|uniref:YerC/YecD family TrpR-related protein n=1 Tax=Butyricicoccus sp. Marseille-Q5471 TaxID=3039493 RepID=UPI0024BC2569|nr:YerC/YecD family TrpR-related protein [Butyricicoccus sp. Marseille-Q5471]
MNRKLKDEDMDILFHGILGLQSVEECYDFFEDLCTIAELRAMVQRFQVARMLDEGRIYSDIVQETGASTATISRVNKCLVYGSDGYRKLLDRLKEQENG